MKWPFVRRKTVDRILMLSAKVAVINFETIEELNKTKEKLCWYENKYGLIDGYLAAYYDHKDNGLTITGAANKHGIPRRRLGEFVKRKDKRCQA
jgi:hypothetical protein